MIGQRDGGCSDSQRADNDCCNGKSRGLPNHNITLLRSMNSLG
jgi:hypothetical protein